MSVLTHSDQVFLGLPLLLALGIVILVMEFMHEEERTTCPYHLKRLVRRAAVTCTPNIAQSVSADTSSSSLTLHIKRTIDLSFRRSCCKSGAVGAQVSLPCHRAERTQALKTFPRVLMDTCLDVRIGRSLLNFPQAVLHLVTMASLHQHVSKVAKVGFHVQLCSIHIYLCDRSIVNLSSLITASWTNIVWILSQSSNTTALLAHPIHCEHWTEFTLTPFRQTAQGNAPES